MDRPQDQDAPKRRKPWMKPVLRKIALTEEKRAALLASEDPMALVRKMKLNLR